MDTDNDGIVSIEELKVGFRNSESQLAESEIQMFIEAVSFVNFTFSTSLLCLKPLVTGPVQLDHSNMRAFLVLSNFSLFLMLCFHIIFQTSVLIWF